MLFIYLKMNTEYCFRFNVNVWLFADEVFRSVMEKALRLFTYLSDPQMSPKTVGYLICLKLALPIGSKKLKCSLFKN